MPARLDALRAFLANFDVALSVDDAGLMAVSTWLPQWGDLLVDDFNDEVWDAYRSFAAPWTGKLIGLNVIFDLAIYYAECLWARRTKMKWAVVHGSDGGAFHLVTGLRDGKFFDPFELMYRQCRNIRAEKRMRWQPDSQMAWFLKPDCLHRDLLSQTPPGRRRRKSA